VANTIFDSAKVLWLTTGLDVTALDIRAVLTRGYTFSQTHDNLDDIGAGLRVSVSPTITGFALLAAATVLSGGCTAHGPVVDCDDFTFTAVAAGAACESIEFYYHTGADATSTLIYHCDTAGVFLPITPNGQDINFTVNAAGLFVL
jgi:hypothetical protein